MKKAIVLSGGGARGAYQIGVWYALKKLRYHYDIVTGTSVGALNGIFLVQNDYKKALSFWKKISPKEIFDEEVGNSIDSLEEKKKLIMQYAKKAVHGGFTVQMLEKNIEKLLNVDKFFESDIDYGLVTFNLSTFKPLELTKKDLDKENIKDYLIASATCFPAFTIKNIHGEQFVDGGYYDNMPINLAIQLGAKEIIAVNLDAIGVQRKVEDQSVKITYIKPNNRIGSFLVFNEKYATRAIQYGYNDTMKKFKKYYGQKYTFKKYRFDQIMNHLENKFKNLLKDIENQKENFLLEQAFHFRTSKSKYTKTLQFIEELGFILGIDDVQIYKLSKFNQLLKKNLKEIELDSKKLEELLEKDWKQVFDRKIMIRYFYEKIQNQNYENLKKVSILFPKEFKFALYLSIL